MIEFRPTGPGAFIDWPRAAEDPYWIVVNPIDSAGWDGENPIHPTWVSYDRAKRFTILEAAYMRSAMVTGGIVREVTPNRYTIIRPRYDGFWKIGAGWEHFRECTKFLPEDKIGFHLPVQGSRWCPIDPWDFEWDPDLTLGDLAADLMEQDGATLEGARAAVNTEENLELGFSGFLAYANAYLRQLNAHTLRISATPIVETLTYGDAREYVTDARGVGNVLNRAVVSPMWQYIRGRFQDEIIYIRITYRVGRDIGGTEDIYIRAIA